MEIEKAPWYESLVVGDEATLKTGRRVVVLGVDIQPKGVLIHVQCMGDGSQYWVGPEEVSRG